MSNSGEKLFGVIVCDSQAKWGGPEGIAKRVEKHFGSEDGRWKTYVAEEGQFPSEEELRTFQGFYITGSKYSVNDDTQKWIKQLELFIQRAYALKKPKVFGTCFGHQVISKALGGKVNLNPSERFVCHNEKIELCEVETDSRFLNDLKEISKKKPFRILQSHSECVEELPANARRIASSATCKNEIILFSDNIIGAQAHADFEVHDVRDIILPSLLEREAITKEEFDHAHESFKQPNACADMAVAICTFLSS
jgi:GMP synthase-like glutamine amidotransferase